MHYYSEKQKSSIRKKEVVIRLKDDVFSLNSGSGVFSKDGLDIASQLLIETAETPEKGKILDLGCGYGVIGISLLRKNPSLEMYFSDVNERALLLTEENLKKHGLNGKIIKSNSFENIKEVFDAILTNPPIAAGRDACYNLIQQSFEHLNKNGTLQLVARHKKGGAMLEKKMKEYFKVSIQSKGSGFRVYKGVKE